MDSLLADLSASRITIYRYDRIFVERKGAWEPVPHQYENEAALLATLNRLLAQDGKVLDEKTPIVEAARVGHDWIMTAVTRPVAPDGTVARLHRITRDQIMTAADMLRLYTLTGDMMEFLRASVIARANIAVAGGGGTGKTTLLNVLSHFIPDDTSIITIENREELSLTQPNVIRLLSRPPDLRGTGDISVHNLLMTALQMRPGRIIIGELRGGETLDYLNAMHSGYDGALCSVSANSPRDTAAQLEVMCLMAGVDLPLRAIREQVAAGLDLIVFMLRMRDGTRRVVNITEVQGIHGDVVVLQDIFEFEQTGYEDGRVLGRFQATGIRPRLSLRIEEAGISLAPAIFSGSQRHDDW